MLTTRMSPKISVNPLATTKYRAASVSPLSVTVTNCFTSSAALRSRKIARMAAKATSAMRLGDHELRAAMDAVLIAPPS